MLIEAFKQLKSALMLLLLFTVLTGLIYPAIVFGVAQFIYPWKANGSLIQVQNKMMGSVLIGQSFTDPKYFWGRPSATSPYPYNATSSSGSNIGPSNPALFSAIKQRIAVLQQADPQNHEPIPVDLVTSSGSGLDPDISPLAAYYQVHRVATARGIPDSVIKQLVAQSIQYPTLGFIGEPRVNVLRLNLALDKLLYLSH